MKPICKDKRPCFAARDIMGERCCDLLTKAYYPGKCPFEKRTREITNGEIYPHNPDYALWLEGRLKCRKMSSYYTT